MNPVGQPARTSVSRRLKELGSGPIFGEKTPVLRKTLTENLDLSPSRRLTMDETGNPRLAFHENSPVPDSPQPDPTPTGVIAGIDYGTVRVGVAVSDAGRSLAMPLATYTRVRPEADGRWFGALVKEQRVTLFVVGLPVHLDGRESQKSREAREFGRWLGETTGVSVVFFDERFTTAQAEEMLQQAKMTSKRRKARRDMLAAQIMLSGYLESDQQGQEEPGPLDD